MERDTPGVIVDNVRVAEGDGRLRRPGGIRRGTGVGGPAVDRELLVPEVPGVVHVPAFVRRRGLGQGAGRAASVVVRAIVEEVLSDDERTGRTVEPRLRSRTGFLGGDRGEGAPARGGLDTSSHLLADRVQLVANRLELHPRERLAASEVLGQRGTK